MKKKDLIECLKNIDDDTEIFIQSDISNICGNIVELDSVRKTSYGFFGILVPCVILDAKAYTCSKRIIEKDEIELHEVEE